MNRKILFVDDEENVLRAFERTLRSHFEVDTAVGAERGLEALAQRGPYAVAVSDLRMPDMDGIQFLSEVRRRSPDTVRLILSGNADLEAVIASVNEGSVFQFLTKPCASEKLHNALNAALKQHQLITAERVLLEQTLNGSVGVMTEVLSVVNPLAFGRASRIRGYVRHMAESLRLPNVWEFDLAAMLSQIGCITVPPEILEKVYARTTLSDVERETFTSHPSIGHGLVTRIPRLETIAEMIQRQMTPLRELNNAKVPDVVAIGAQMLMAALCFDEFISRGVLPGPALQYMQDRPEEYLASLVAALETAAISSDRLKTQTLFLRDIRAGMIVHEDIRAQNGFLLVPKGQAVSEALVARLNNFGRTAGVIEPFTVLVPVAEGFQPEAASTEVHV